MTSEMKAKSLPTHIGIIMDGNGRWAQKRGLSRSFGHRQGAKAMDACIKNIKQLSIPYVSFYAFSTENWKRSKEEVDALMELLDTYLDDIIKRQDPDVRLLFLGDLSPFSQETQRKLKLAQEKTVNNQRLTVSICLNYGGRNEILHAVRCFAQDVNEGKTDLNSISESKFAEYLYTAQLPDVDLVIRPSGEKRISNFLLWQSAYAEFVFLDVLWPDFKMKHLKQALDEYSERSRRFGGV